MHSTERFSSRVENYVKFRPGYPAGLIELLRRECGLGAGSTIADIGSGTGILTEMLLKSGATVFGIEPNGPMREAAEKLLAGRQDFHSVIGTAESTTLRDHSVNLITAAQAFHWFDAPKARREFVRILKPGGHVALIWNDRKTEKPFLEAYESLLLTYGKDYTQVNHRNIDTAAIAAFFSPNAFADAAIPNSQVMDLAALTGRLLSSSYAPELGHPKYEPMLWDLRAIFEKYESGGTVTFDYDTLVYYGRLTEE
jgi:ubiquinone/menaquinone biosynthesis C-methylase UbiE